MIPGLIALALVMGLAMQAAADPIQQIVTVLRVKGAARYSTDGKTYQTLQKGDVLKPGALVQTAPESEVDLQLGGTSGAGTTQVVNKNANGLNDVYNGTIIGNKGGGLYNPDAEESANIVRIQENSVLSIDKLTVEQTGADTVEETQLDLRAGSIVGNVKKMSAASKYEVKIPNGVAGIRGTFYFLSSAGVVDVVLGSVVIAVVHADGTVVTKVVTAGFKYDPLTGILSKIPPLEEKLLAAIARTLHLTSPPTFYPIPTGIVYVSPVR